LTTLRAASYKSPDSREDRGTSGSGKREADERVEELSRRLADVINEAGADSRQDLRQYALDLLKEETEVLDATPVTATRPTAGGGSNAISMALMLGLASLPLMLFPGVGLVVLGLAVLIGLWGIASTFLRGARKSG